MAQELKADNTFVFGEECLAYKKSEADKVIAELEAKIERLKNELRYVDEVTEGQAGLAVWTYEEKLRITKRAVWLSRARAAETGRRFWAKEQLFAMREGRKKDSEKAWKMEKRRERQVRVFTAKAMEVKI